MITICLCRVYGFEFPDNVDFLNSCSSTCHTFVFFFFFSGQFYYFLWLISLSVIFFIFMHAFWLVIFYCSMFQMKRVMESDAAMTEDLIAYNIIPMDAQTITNAIVSLGEVITSVTFALLFFLSILDLMKILLR